MKKMAMGCVLVLALLAASALGAFYYITGGLPFGSSTPKQRIQKEALLKGRINIMVMGVDERVDDVGRSDTLMVFMIDPKTEKVELLSIPRDTLVQIPGRGWDKINHAYAYGGQPLTRATVEDLLGIKIDNYVLVDIKGFKGIVDAMGGVDINVSTRMYYEDPWDDDGLVIDFQPGMQHMDGQKAMEYVRYRDEEGDIGRIRRQQQFMQAVYDKMTSPGNLTNLPKLIAVVSRMVKTDVYSGKITPLVGSLRAAVKNGLRGSSVPGEPKYIGEVSYWVPDVNATRDLVVAMQGATITNAFAKDTKELAAAYSAAKPPRTMEESGSKDKKDKAKDQGDKDKTDKDKSETADKEKEINKDKPNKTRNKTTTIKKSVEKNTPDDQDIDKQGKSGIDWNDKTLNIVLVKCTDNTQAVSKIKEVLAARNMRVVAVREGEIRPGSLIVSSNDRPELLNRLFKLPFNTGVRTGGNGDASVDAVIFLGRDFS